jgi:hypothetical protein
MPEVIQKLPMMHQRASVKSDSIDLEKRTIDVCFGTDKPVLMGYWERFFEILKFDAKNVRMERINSGAPLLKDHRSGIQIGVVERAWVDGKEGFATIRFSKNEDGEKEWKDVVDGIRRNVSVGYSVHEYREVSGGEGKTPTYEATDWEPFEISMVSVPADYKAGVREHANETEVKIFKINSNQNRNTMPQTEEEIALLARQKAEKDAADKKAAEELSARLASEKTAGIEAERKRTTEITTAVRKANLPMEFAEKLITDGKSINEVRELIIDEFAKNDPNAGARGNVTVTGKDEAEKIREAQSAALILRSHPEFESKKIISAEVVAAAREHRGKSLLDMAKECLIRSGVDIRGLDKMEIAGRAISSSTSDFPVLLSGVNRQVLLASYNAVADTWRIICKVGSVSDFREFKRLRMGTLSNLETVNENGEFKNKPLTDADYETISASTKGNLINVSRQMIVNDDLNGFTQLAGMLGRAAARSIESDFYALLASNPTMADGKALFHADHNNIAATAAVPTVASFDAVRQQMKAIKDKDNNDYLDITPAIWLGPTAYSGSAKVVNDAQFDVDSTKFQVPNKSRGMYKTMVDSPRLSGTAWYTFADPNIEPVFEVVFLDGNQTPYMESQMGFNVDGITWKVRHDYGVGAIGYKGAVKNAGA